LLLRAQIIALLDRLSDFEGWGVKARFGREIAQLATDAGVVTQYLAEAGTAVGSLARQAERRLIQEDEAEDGSRLVGLEPFMADPEINILAAWREIEVALRNAAQSADISINKGIGPLGIARQLVAAHRITNETYRNIQNAARLRNAVAHASHSGISLNDALAYRQTALAIAEAVREETHKNG